MNIFVCIYDYNDKYKNTYAPWRAARLYAAKNVVNLNVNVTSQHLIIQRKPTKGRISEHKER